MMLRTASACAALVVLLLVVAVPGETGTITREDREASYPSELTNVTHSPWGPMAGEDLKVVATLAPDAPVPDAVSLLYCRVEPVYTCALPLMMSPDAKARTWRATIEWTSRFMEPETVHVGYNVTLRYPDQEVPGGVRRVSAPTGNFWLPSTFPSDSDGVYFFVSYERGAGVDRTLPTVALPLLIVVAAASVWWWRR